MRARDNAQDKLDELARLWGVYGGELPQVHFEQVDSVWSLPAEVALWVPRNELDNFRQAVIRRGEFAMWSKDYPAGGKGPNHTAWLLWSVRDKPKLAALVILHAFMFQFTNPRSRLYSGVLGRCCSAMEEEEGVPPLSAFDLEPWHHAMTSALPDGVGELYNRMFGDVPRREFSASTASVYLPAFAIADYALCVQRYALVHVNLEMRQS